MTLAELKITSGFWMTGSTAAIDAAVTPRRETLGDGLWTEAAWTTGTGSGQVDLVAPALLSIPVSTFVEIDLFGGLILDNAGATISTLYELPGGSAALFQTLKGIRVRMASGATGVRIGGAATAAHGLWFDAITRTWDMEYSGCDFLGGGPTGKTVTALIRRLRFLNLSGVSVASVLVSLGGVRQ